MQANFEPSLALVLKSEGGYVDDPRDPGGATNMGITLKTLAAWRGINPSWKLQPSDVKALTMAEAGAIYKAHFWDAVAGDQLPAGLDYAVFDYGVNSGPAKAVITLQGILGVAQDGKIGPLTLAAIGKSFSPDLIGQLCDSRLAFLKTLSTFAVFGNGWSSRVAAVRAAGRAMAGPLPSAQPGVPFPPLPRPTPLPPAKPAPTGFWQALLAFIISLFSRKV